MISKTNKILQIIRDFIVLLPSAVVIIPSYQEMMRGSQVHILLVGIFGLFILLSLINLMLIVVKVESRAYYYFNAIFQLIPLFIIGGFGSGGGNMPVVLIALAMMALNIAIIITLKKKKHILKKRHK